MTKIVQVCYICGFEIGKVHECETSKLHADHILYNHRDIYIKLAEIADKIEELEDEFKSLSGRYSRDKIYYHTK